MTSTARKAPRLLVRSAQVAIAAAAVTDVFRTVAVRDRYLHDTDTSESGFASMVFVYVTTLAIVLFLVWLAQVRRNAEELSPEAAVPSRGRTIGMWFVPFAHLFVPRQVVLDIGRASSPSWAAKRDTTLVNAWWVAWIAHSLVLGFAGRLAPGSMTLLVVEEVLMVAAALLAGLVIERITALQDAAFDAAVPAESPAQA
ncbi:DUF4328 domain-containing protein [Streptomyces sp. NPDC101776]|uniref:DUF4328 domain-containing protein n=1 Tax=Streptomyces sp. NPDC101776 TaxID=3366146 RepID=UPI0037F9541E